jgi:hypothetical protein
MTTIEESEAIHVLKAYIKEWGTKPTAVEIAGYETPEGIYSKYMMSTMMAAQNLRSLYRRGKVTRWKTKFGFVYAPSEIG